MKKLKLLFLLIFKETKAVHLLLIGLILLVGFNIYKQVFAPITINGQNIRLTKKESKTIIDIENEKISKTLIEIETLTYKLDSCKYVLDSVLYRKRSNLDTLQRWFNHY